MHVVGVDALELCVNCSNVGSFDLIVQDIVSLFPDALEHDPHCLGEFRL